MTTDRAWKLAQQVATVVLQGGPHSEAVLRDRITSQVAGLLLNVDWRVLPEDEREAPGAPDLFDGQLGLPL